MSGTTQQSIIINVWFCQTPLMLSSPAIFKTQHVQHLHSKGWAKLQKGVEEMQIVKELSPTPALCGLPKQQAFSTIQALEPFDRFLFGGVIGWSHHDQSDWIVVIRSCQIQKNRAILFSAAGIVEGSDPEKEWEELNHKIRLYEGILDH